MSEGNKKKKSNIQTTNEFDIEARIAATRLISLFASLFGNNASHALDHKIAPPNAAIRTKYEKDFKAQTDAFNENIKNFFNYTPTDDQIASASSNGDLTELAKEAEASPESYKGDAVPSASSDDDLTELVKAATALLETYKKFSTVTTLGRANTAQAAYFRKTSPDDEAKTIREIEDSISLIMKYTDSKEFRNCDFAYKRQAVTELYFNSDTNAQKANEALEKMGLGMILVDDSSSDSGDNRSAGVRASNTNNTSSFIQQATFPEYIALKFLQNLTCHYKRNEENANLTQQDVLKRVLKETVEALSPDKIQDLAKVNEVIKTIFRQYLGVQALNGQIKKQLLPLDEFSGIEHAGKMSLVNLFAAMPIFYGEDSKIVELKTEIRKTVMNALARQMKGEHVKSDFSSAIDELSEKPAAYSMLEASMSK